MNIVVTVKFDCGTTSCLKTGIDKRDEHLYKHLESAKYKTAVLTVDKSIPFQQRLNDRPVSVAVLRAKSNSLPDLLKLVPKLLEVLNEIAPGEVKEVS